uniref:Putative Six-hairpin glycosidase n=1 Tax=Moniliophthora roreri TaxID=221103 RepID=A0A0W0EY35_MONRR
MLSEHIREPPDSNVPRTIRIDDVFLEHRTLSQESITRPNYILKGTWNGWNVIVKKLSQESRLDQLVQRASVWRGLKHPNVLDVYGISEQNENPLFVVLPSQGNGNIRQWTTGRLDMDLRTLVLDIATGMRYLHTNGVIHGGLKPSNVLINIDERACVSDYDMVHIQPSRCLDAHRYFSPEAWKGTTSKPSDVFAFAMCALEVFTSSLPWGFHSEKRIYRLLVQENARPDRPDDPAVLRKGLTDKVWSIIEECWSREARLRPSFDIIVDMWQDPVLDEGSYGTAGGQRMSPDATLFDNRDRATSANGRRHGVSVSSYASGPPAYHESEVPENSEETEPSPGYADYTQVTSVRNAPSLEFDSNENDDDYISPAHAHNKFVRGMSSGESSSSVGTSSSRGWRSPPGSPQTPGTPPSSRSIKYSYSSPSQYPTSSRISPTRSQPVRGHNRQLTTDSSASQSSNRQLTAPSTRLSSIESDLVRALPTLSRDENLRRWEAAQGEYSPQPSTSAHRHYLPSQFTSEPLEAIMDAVSVDESCGYSFKMGSQVSSRSTIGANPSAVLLVQALQAEVREGRKKESVDGYLVKMYEVAMDSEKESYKLVNAGAVPTLIHLLKVRAAEQYGVEIVLITLGTLAYDFIISRALIRADKNVARRDSISANVIYRTGTAATLVELFNSPPTDDIQTLAIWCLTRICRSADVANGLVKLNLASMLIRVQTRLGPIMPIMSLFFLGTLVQSDSLAEFLASLGFVQMICIHLRSCSELEVPSPDSVSAGLYAVARMSRSIPLAKALAKAGCVEIIAHHLKTSTDPDVLHWSARAVGCLMRPNSSDMSKILLDADIARGLARLPTVLPPDSFHPLGSFGFAIQRFSCAEWGGSTRKALVEAGVVDSLLAALRTAADEPCYDVHVELALAICLLGDVGGSSIRKEISNAGGVEILKSVGGAGSPDVTRACNMAVTSITGNLFSRNAGFLFLSLFPTGLLARAPAGPWDKFNFAPSSRIVHPVSVRHVEGTVRNADRLADTTDGVATFGEGSWVALDFGVEVGGLISLTFSNTSSDSSISLSFTESPLFISPVTSDDSTRSAASQSYDGVLKVLSPLRNGFWTQPAAWLRGGFRYLTVVSTGRTVGISNVSCEISFLPHMDDMRAYSGYFWMKDRTTGWGWDDEDFLTKLWYAGAYTVQTNTVPLNTGRRIPFVSAGSWANDARLGVAGPIIVDGAKRDRAVWPGDMGIAVPTSFVSTNDLLPVKNALLTMFSGIASDGALPESGPPLNQKGSDTYHGWTLIGSYNYYLYTADLPFLQNIWTNYTRAVAFLERKVDRSKGLMNVTGLRDWARLGGGGINAEGNAILYKVLTTASSLASYLAEETNDSEALALSEAYARNATRLKEAFNKEFWMEDVGMYRDNSSTTLAPQDANSFAVLYNLTAEESWKERISEGLTKNWGELGPEAPELPDTISPFIGSFELQAHFEANQNARALDLLHRTWGYMLYTNISVQSTLLEGFTVDGSLGYRSNYGYNHDAAYTSHAHGWSSGPTSALINYVLGLGVDEPMGRVWTVHPHLFNVEEDAAEGGFETPLGWFGVSWTVDEGRMMEVNISAPEGTKGAFIAPVGVDRARVVVNGGEVTEVNGEERFEVEVDG